MKCSCRHCGDHIEYDAASAGLEIACPHCNRLTRLAAYASPPPVPGSTANDPKKKMPGWVIALLIAAGCLVLLLPVLLLAAIAVPNFVKARHQAQRAACSSNLHMIQGAKEMWALEHKKTATETPSEKDLFGEAKYLKQKPVCPAQGVYTINAAIISPTCTIPSHTY